MPTQRIQLNVDHGPHKAGAVIDAHTDALRASDLAPGTGYAPLGTHPGPVPCQLSGGAGEVTDRAIKQPPRK